MATADWYPDPQNPTILRWWDGANWTAHTRQAFPATAFSAHGQRAPAADGGAQLTGLQADILAAETRLRDLRSQLESVENAIEIQSFGFYRPRYNFVTAEEYKSRLKEVREQQKALIKGERAAHCPTKWTVGGSEAEGRKMIRSLSKLILRAFNGECDAAIATVRYDNVLKLEERLKKTFEEINKLSASNHISITTEYYEAKLDELHLVHEHQEKVHEEKEAQREIRERLRDEQKAREEIERAQQAAEADEERNERALAKARAELAEATGKQHEKLAELVTKLETELKDAIDRKAKAIARAQLTRSGHVYVLSNIGSFGEGVYKIGLTRRLDPYERIHELGTAAVPFRFDVHAIIYSEDAPALEAALHREFDARRVNMVNRRKEYFRVTLQEIQDAVKRLFGTVTWTLEPEAEDWRKTVAEQSAEAPPLPPPIGPSD